MLQRFSAWLLGLDPFWRDVIKLVLDKVLLGAVAAYIVYRLARSLEKQKSKTAVELERSKQRDLSIMNAWYAIRHLELESVAAEHQFQDPGSLVPYAMRRLPDDVANRVNEAHRAAIETLGKERPRLPKGLFDTFVELQNTRMKLLHSFEPVQLDLKGIEELRSRAHQIEERAKALVEKHLGSLPSD